MAEFIPDPAMMQRALELADEAAALEEVPVGAVIVHKPTGRIIGEGYNRRGDRPFAPGTHAEIMAIDQASRTLGGWRLLDSVLYVTLEPCPMCAGAILHARLDQVVFGTRDPKGGAVRSMEEMFALPYHWKPEIYEGLLQAECAGKLTNFFRMLRAKKKQAQQK
ncbi:tRNA adenosine(34) deaminase TadA [Ruminococcus sp.]|uniref:tRNA adenosine(34) deaminase TadA n=1 Tax=Ruminococcus sp. TaxID=41978 RepID=UPI003993F640